ncbi:putative membrane protein YhjC [Flexivirga endophytica]|uniref:Membrane protein YhjC n=1 Tax=Flexivirga endophytica TaxID=1849103 RepID=A0A916WQD5_9MICO|nr:DUF3311 domain-containing protein [Flexivirga endophytica]GGB19859.1 putative membrane protein YhjC [Flexivirga endophytica]GHB35848.1 putative membrane protein YhjC [Flexivirga endophytica]
MTRKLHRIHLGLAALPFVLMLVCTPFVNRTTPTFAGFPFLLIWIVVSVLLTSVCMAIVYRTDPANSVDEEGEA